MSTLASHSPPAARIEELGRIIMAYSEVTEKLQASHDQLQQTVQALSNELSDKNRELERRNRLAALGEMAAGMAHEIRNPLGGIQLYASMLAGDVADRPDSLQLVAKISAGVKRLEALVSQVLNFSRDLRVSITETDLSEIVVNAVELAQQQLRARDIRCDLHGPSPMPARVDADLIGQVTLNLILNAVEAMDSPGGTISIRWRACEKDPSRQFHLSIHDGGPGVPANILDRIFNPFFTTRDTGTGLGLAIVHRVVEAHDGTIVVTNPPEGGAKFEIRI